MNPETSWMDWPAADTRNAWLTDEARTGYNNCMTDEHFIAHHTLKLCGVVICTLRASNRRILCDNYHLPLRVVVTIWNCALLNPWATISYQFLVSISPISMVYLWPHRVWRCYTCISGVTNPIYTMLDLKAEVHAPYVFAHMHAITYHSFAMRLGWNHWWTSKC